MPKAHIFESQNERLMNTSMINRLKNFAYVV